MRPEEKKDRLAFEIRQADDQKRVMTVEGALRGGADYLVVMASTPQRPSTSCSRVSWPRAGAAH